MTQFGSRRSERWLLGALLGGLVLAGQASAAEAPGPNTFNRYILDAVEILNAKYASQGYGSASYTHDLPYGGATVKASNPSLTMCVAATAEVMITAINLYVEKTGDRTPYDYLPAKGWVAMRPRDIRAHIWVDHHLKSAGTADAMATFAIGHHVKFAELLPGDFINLNRSNRTGHAVIFLGFIDNLGEIQSTHSAKVTGFKYFSAQGSGRTGDSGFAYRYAYFDKAGQPSNCPTLPAGKRRDCHVIWSTGQNMLNTGRMLAPKLWDAKKRDANLAVLTERLYAQTKTRGPEFLGMPSDINRADFERELETKDTMSLNAKFLANNLTTDD